MNDDLPIVRVTSLDGDVIAVPREIGRDDPIPLRVDVAEWRLQLISQVTHAQDRIAAQSAAFPGVPSVLRVRLTKMAKSYRPAPPNPKPLFLTSTCPLIGVEPGRHLLVRATTSGVRELRARLSNLKGEWADFHVSNIEEIAAFTSAASGVDGIVLEELAASWDEQPLYVRLFDHQSPVVNSALHSAFTRYVESLGIRSVTPLDAGAHVTVFAVAAPRGGGVSSSSGSRREVIERLADFPGTQRVSRPPVVTTVRAAAGVISPMPRTTFPPPDADAHYPTVGLIDTGIDPGNDFFNQGWIVERRHHVTTDFDHGTRVGSLLVHPRRMNQNHPWFPDCSSKIVDVAVIGVGEYAVDHNELVARIEDALVAHPDVRVWNLSFAMAHRRAMDDIIHPMTNKLDELQRAYDVLFIFAGGNVSEPDLFTPWPPPTTLSDDRRRILVPSDSALGVTVGGLAHVDRPGSSMNQRGAPSPFNRHGPGIGGMPKPELIHCAGNVGADGTCFETGVIAMNREWKLAELHGVSFAAPLVATTAAHLDLRLTEVLGQRPHRALLKGLLIHSAAANDMEALAYDKSAIQFRGFGTPPSPERVLTCRPHEMTMIFEADICPGYSQRFFKTNFPLPDCLRVSTAKKVNAFRGDVILTVACDPPLNAAYASEYCSLDLKAKFGTLEDDEEFTGKMPEDKAKTEIRQISEDQKWSPIKVHTRQFRGTTGDTWELRVEVQARDYYTERQPQKFFVIMTVRDPHGKAPVYDQMSIRMRQLGWPVQPLVRNRLRPR